MSPSKVSLSLPQNVRKCALIYTISVQFGTHLDSSAMANSTSPVLLEVKLLWDLWLPSARCSLSVCQCRSRLVFSLFYRPAEGLTSCLSSFPHHFMMRNKSWQLCKTKDSSKLTRNRTVSSVIYQNSTSDY